MTTDPTYDPREAPTNMAEDFKGTGKDDTFEGTNSDELIIGAQGDDLLEGKGGNDVLFGDGHDDTILGGDGDDFITGDNERNTETDGYDDGADHLEGGAGDDTIFGGGGDDVISGDYSKSQNKDLTAGDDDVIDGGAGNDIIGGKGGHDDIKGGEGNDTIWGDDGSDTIDGGAGDDLIRGDTEKLSQYDGKGLADNDDIDGGDGNDTVEAGAGNDTVRGGDGDDTLLGEEGNDRLFGGDGNDVALGGDGNDRVKGEDGDDTLSGGDGNDSLSGGDGNDELSGGDGNDRLNGGDGDDAITGGEGRDTVFAGSGDDTADGGADNDWLQMNGGDDVAEGGEGNDNILGGGGDDTLNGGEGNDKLYGDLNSGNGSGYADEDGNVDFTREGTTTVKESGSTHKVKFGDTDEPGSDYGEHVKLGEGEAVKATVQMDKLDDGEAGKVTLFKDGKAVGEIEFTGADQTSWGGLRIDADGQTFDEVRVEALPVDGEDPDGAYTHEGSEFRLKSVDFGVVGNDELNGGDGDDYANGGYGHDVVNGQAGDDTLQGAQGNDTLNGGTGDDLIQGGDGRDTVDYSDATEGVYVNIRGEENHDGEGTGNGYAEANDKNKFIDKHHAGNTGDKADVNDNAVGNDTLESIENVNGSEYNDFVDGSHAENRIVGNGGDDVLVGHGEDDTVKGGEGDDTIYGDRNWLKHGEEVPDGDDKLHGGKGDDKIYGDSVDPNGKGGSATEGGDDTITGGAGNDTIDGGAGSDTVKYGGKNGVNVDLTAGTAEELDKDGNVQYTDTLKNIENVKGTNGADTVIGNDEDNTFITGNNRSGDEFHGGEGNDTLNLSRIKPTDEGDGFNAPDGWEKWVPEEAVFNGDGSKKEYDGVMLSLDEDLQVRESNQGIDIEYSSVENVTGTRGSDILRGSQEDNVIKTGKGDDLAIGWGGDDTIKGGKGDDILIGDDAAEKETGNDVLKGGRGDDILLGGKGEDLLDGGKDDDLLDGGEGADRLLGGRGDDVLVWDDADFVDEDGQEITHTKINKKGKEKEIATYDGGKGFDVLDASAAEDTVNLTGKKVKGVEAVIGAGTDAGQTAKVSLDEIYRESDSDDKNNKKVDDAFDDVFYAIGFTNLSLTGKQKKGTDQWNKGNQADARGDDLTEIAAGDDTNKAEETMVNAAASTSLRSFVFTWGSKTVTVWTDAVTVDLNGADISGWGV